MKSGENEMRPGKILIRESYLECGLGDEANDGDSA